MPHAPYLNHLIVSQTPDDDRLSYNALWGKLAAEILMQNWDAALDDLNKLKDVIDSSVITSLALDLLPTVAVP